ncbi:YtvA family blue-light photoreceptor [Alkalicoccobacillus murimartini]|uniref:PAS domain S-box-containing protein n=1 Tax=Alkalicoccobacillus murimartini TaxID=171685 RepID=A0ABT9YEW0_9BACI|nr:PAS domain-containing protein [Alkalicoccobacillus murimartini]MDQ0206158.1 PAS domain S-box-containing protein [Alkalicoccobacillus murimartini]
MKAIIEQAELLVEILDYTRVGILVTDPDLPDNEIIYVSKGFTSMTGYTVEETLQTNCRFLQGEDTDPESVQLLREAIQKRESITIEILNYKKNGKPFWNELTIDPVYLEKEDKHYFVGIQKDITDQKLTENEYKHSLEQIRSISTPIVPLLDGLAVLPLIGQVDGERFTEMFSQITSETVKLKTETLVLDLSGLETFDDEVVDGIYRLRDVLTLIGTELIVCGMRPDLAMKSIQLDREGLHAIKTASSVKKILSELYLLDKGENES